MESDVVVRKARAQEGRAIAQVIAYSFEKDFSVLDVTDTNLSAQKCYTDFGFVEYDRIPVKFGTAKGFHAKIYMRYARLAS